MLSRNTIRAWIGIIIVSSMFIMGEDGDWTPPRERIVFVTQEVLWVDGDFGGLAVADEYCQWTAELCGLTGTYKAWLSDDEHNSPSNRFTKDGIFKLVDGTMVAAGGWSDLTDGDIDHEINLDCLGNVVPGEWVWTSTLASGISSFPNCDNWTTNRTEALGLSGWLNSTDYHWTEFVYNTCSHPHAFYCFQQ